MKLFRPDLFRAPPACVLIDLDNTLYAYAPCHRAGQSAARRFAEETLALPPSDFDRCFDIARVEIKQRLGDTAASHHRLLYFQRTLERAGLASRALHAIQMEQAYWGAYLHAAELFPHAMDLLDDLRMADIPVQIVTDLTAQIQLRKIVAFELDSRIDWITTSEESGHDKPHPASFELAIAKLGGVEGPIWMIGDNHHCDLIGGKQAIGATTLQIRHAGVTQAPEGCTYTDAAFASFADVRRLVAGLIRG